MSFFGSVETIVAEALRAVDEGDADVRGALDDVEGGQDRAVGVDDHACAEAGGVALVGGALGLDLDERGQDLLVGDGRRCRRRLEVLDRLLDDAGRDRADLRLVERRRRRVAGRGVDPAADEHDEDDQSCEPHAPPPTESATARQAVRRMGRADVSGRAPLALTQMILLGPFSPVCGAFVAVPVATQVRPCQIRGPSGIEKSRAGSRRRSSRVITACDLRLSGAV